MTARLPVYYSEKDTTPWRPLAVANPFGLPSRAEHHVMTFAPRRAGWPPVWSCSACDFETPDPGNAAGHLASTQYVVGYRPPAIAVERPAGNADDRGEV